MGSEKTGLAIHCYNDNFGFTVLVKALITSIPEYKAGLSIE